MVLAFHLGLQSVSRGIWGGARVLRGGQLSWTTLLRLLQSQSPIPSWRPYFPWQPQTSSLSGSLCPTWRIHGWMIGFWVQDLKLNHAPYQCYSSWRCMRRSQSLGSHFLLPEATLLPPPPSLPSMVVWRSPRQSMWLQCIYARKVQPPGGFIHVSHPRPVNWRQPWLVRLSVQLDW